MPMRATRSKYGNSKVHLDGYIFDSEKESRRYIELKLLGRAKEIEALEVHPTWDLHVPCKGEPQRVGRFTADFMYFVRADNEWIIEDVKSPITRLETAYRLRKRMVEAEYGIAICEV